MITPKQGNQATTELGLNNKDVQVIRVLHFQ